MRWKWCFYNSDNSSIHININSTFSMRIFSIQHGSSHLLQCTIESVLQCPAFMYCPSGESSAAFWIEVAFLVNAPKNNIHPRTWTDYKYESIWTSSTKQKKRKTTWSGDFSQWLGLPLLRPPEIILGEEERQRAERLKLANNCQEAACLLQC